MNSEQDQTEFHEAELHRLTRHNDKGTGPTEGSELAMRSGPTASCRVSLILVVVLLTALVVGTLPVTSHAQTNRVPQRTRSEAEQRQLAAQKSRAASGLERRGRYESALDIWLDLHDAYPEDNNYVNGVIRCLTTLGRNEDAARRIEDRLPLEVDLRRKAELYAQLGGVYSAMDKRTQAEINWRKAEETARGQAGAYYDVAMMFLRQRQRDRSIDMLKQAREDLENPYLHAYTIASLHQSSMDWEGAAEEYLLALRENNHRRVSVLRSLASFPTDSSADAAVSRAVRVELEATESDAPWEGYRDALWQILVDQKIKNGRFEAAVDLLEDIAEEQGDGGWLLQFAQTAVDEGALDAARRALEIAGRRVVSEVRRNEVNLSLAMLARAEERYAKADSLYALVISTMRKDRNHAQEALLERSRMRLMELDDAEAALKDLATLAESPHPNYIQEMEYLTGAALLRLGRYDKALPHLQAAVRPTVEPDPRQRQRRSAPQFNPELAAQATLLKARVAWWQHQPAKTTALLDSMLSNPTGAEVENDAFDLLMLLGGEADSLALRRFARADQAVFEHRIAEAESLLTDLAEDTGTVASEAAWRLAWLATATGDLAVPDALTTFINRFPDTPRAEEAWLEMGIWYEAHGQTNEAQTCYETILIDYHDGLLTSEARLRLDRLSGMELPPLQPPPVFDTP